MGMLLTFVLIFLAKITEVTIMTVRMVLITKGERKLGSILAFFEVAIWLFLVSTVLDNITAQPIKAVAYSLGFAVGNYTGSLLEEKIGIGLSEVQCILLKEHGAIVAKALRDAGFAVTTLQAEGKNHPREILLMYVSRKKIKSCVDTIREIQENAVITVTDRKPVYGGFNMIRK